MIENKVNVERNPTWFKNYEKFKSFEWQYCLYPESVCDEENY